MGSRRGGVQLRLNACPMKMQGIFHRGEAKLAEACPLMGIPFFILFFPIHKVDSETTLLLSQEIGMVSPDFKKPFRCLGVGGCGLMHAEHTRSLRLHHCLLANGCTEVRPSGRRLQCIVMDWLFLSCRWRAKLSFDRREASMS